MLSAIRNLSSPCNDPRIIITKVGKADCETEKEREEGEGERKRENSRIIFGGNTACGIARVPEGFS